MASDDRLVTPTQADSPRVDASSNQAAYPKPPPLATAAATRQNPHTGWEAREETMASHSNTPRTRSTTHEKISQKTNRQRQCDVWSKVKCAPLHPIAIKSLSTMAPEPCQKDAASPQPPNPESQLLFELQTFLLDPSQAGLMWHPG